MIATTLGCLSEVIGYAGRIKLHQNPYSKAGFNMQIVCLIIAPAFFAAGIYLTLKHLTLCFGSEHSLIRPKYYTWLFICCDIVSLILQGAGGGISATADTYTKQKSGNDLALSGIVFQVFTLLVFAAMGAMYYFRRRAANPTMSREALHISQKTNFKLFMVGIVIAYVGILTRCAYRISEMAPGWRNSIMVSEIDFMVLDGAMIAISVFFMSVFHPGYCFPRLGATLARVKGDGSSKAMGGDSIGSGEKLSSSDGQVQP